MMYIVRLGHTNVDGVEGSMRLTSSLACPCTTTLAGRMEGEGMPAAARVRLVPALSAAGLEAAWSSLRPLLLVSVTLEVVGLVVS
jgi:hypothetical protein